MKKYPIILVLCVLILTSMSKCEDNNIFHHTVENPVSATIDNIVYYSEPEKILNYGSNPHFFDQKDSTFAFCLIRELKTEDKSRRATSLYISVQTEQSQPFQLNKRYKAFNTEEEHSNRIYTSTSYISFLYDSLKMSTHYATSGWVEFKELTNDKKSISGIFELDCEDFDGRQIKIRNGTFGPIELE